MVSRWGLSLEAIAPIVDDEMGSGLKNLEQTARASEGQVVELNLQRNRLIEIIEKVKVGEAIVAVTANTRSFYDQVLERLTDDDAKDLVRREMFLVQLFTQRRFLNSSVELDAMMVRLPQDVVERAAYFYNEFAKLSRAPAGQDVRRCDCRIRVVFPKHRSSLR